MSRNKRKCDETGEESSSSKRSREKDDEEELSEDFLREIAPVTCVSTEPEAGIIEQITLKNFMCHGLLDIKLGPHVNFIIGRNGTGKSAIVTGIVVGLGGSAVTASRGTSVKSFVKTGKHTAEVEIRLRNCGVDPYRHDSYGDSIVVQRKISADGGSKYCLKNANGKTVSDKKEELTKITEHLNIQVNNPVAVLNQDTSRNFLHSKNPSDKYKFFFKATQLEQIRNSYDDTAFNMNQSAVLVQQGEKKLVAMKTEVDKWEKKYKSLGTLDELKRKVKGLKNEMAWSFVAEREKALEPFQKTVENEERRLPKFQQKAEESKNKVRECQDKLKAVKEELLSVTQEAERLQPLLREKREAFSCAKQEQCNVQNEAKGIDKEMQNALTERQQIQDRIKELQQRNQTDYDTERLQREEKIQNVQEKLRNLEARQRTKQHEQEQFQNAISRYKNELYNLGNDDSNTRAEKQQCEKNIKTLESARSDRFKRFGPWVPSALAKIEEYTRLGRFTKRPRGPLGACFQLKDHSWTLAVESCLRSLIPCFVCNDHRDEALLEQVFIEAGSKRRPSIITCRFRDAVHDVSKYRVMQSKYPTVLDVIECDDPVVLNALIDQRSIENIILIPEAPEARQVMMYQPPRNTKEAFTKEGDHLYCHPTFRNYSSDCSVAKFLMSNVEDQIRAQQQIYRQLEAELQQLNQRKQQLQREINSNQKEEKQCETQLMKLNEAINSLRFELQELRNIEDPLPVDVTTLEEDVQEYTRQITELEKRKAEVTPVLKEKNEQLAKAEKEFREVQSELQTRAHSDIPLKDELAKAEQVLAEAQHNNKYYQDKLKEQQANIAKQRKHIGDEQKAIEVDIGKARRMHEERINTRRTPVDIEKEITQIMSRIQEEEEVQGDPEEITRQLMDKRDRFLKTKNFLQVEKHFLQLLGKALDIRNQAFADFRRTIALRTKYFFIVMLSHRHYVGSMTFDHDKKTLEMLVSPSEDSELNRDLKSLSGGERSFSTVCFILSLWNAMESPFRCLDEFDVFMDLVNRRIAMDMMLRMTKNMMNKQFIFLTPQDMSQLNTSIVDRPRIFQMPDPERTDHGQTTLPFRRQNANKD